MQENGVATDAVIPEVLTRMRQFTQMNKLKKNALKVNSWALSVYLHGVLVVCKSHYRLQLTNPCLCADLDYVF